MKQILRTTLLAAGLSLFAPMALANISFIDGNTLRLYCNSGSPQDEAVCIVYITGVVDAFKTAEKIAEETSGQAPGLCVPDEAGPEAMKTITKEWLERPEVNLNYGATLLILAAVDDAYGCDNAK